jgi:hypothetical protein
VVAGVRQGWLWFLIAAACATEPNYEGRLCNTASPCPAGFTCGPDDRCHRGPIAGDAGELDAAPLDAKPKDAEPLDAEVLDAEPGEAGPRDADPSDGDAADADPADAEPLDADPIDADTPDSGEHAIQIRIAAGNDDAMQDPGGPILIAYGWISLYSLDHWGATRFTVPEIPQGTAIDAAYLDVYVDSDMEDTPNMTLYVEPSASPAPISTTSGDISARPLSIASVDWMGIDTGAGWQRSPDLRALVQEVVDLPGWAPGSPILFIWDTQSADDFEFRQWDYDGTGAFAAQLTIRYRVQ